MRESASQKRLNEELRRARGEAPDGERREVPCDERVFFESFYAANVSGEPQDWMTMGSISEPEARFHYNAVENSIIRALLRVSPPPADRMVGVWRASQKRLGLRQLDVGSGTGHWIDFMREAFLVREAVALEVTESMAGFLERKYADVDGVTVQSLDVAAAGSLGSLGAFDLVTAIGVLFHVVDDARWEAAVANLAGVLQPDGLLLISGDFGAETRNVQFHRDDAFQSWRDYEAASADDAGDVRVNKRVRSEQDWRGLAARLDLEVVDLIRSDGDPAITTAENDLLVLRRAP